MKAVLVNYNYDPKDWWKEYGIEAIVYDRSDDNVPRTFDALTFKTENRGNVDYDKLGYLIQNYDSLPEVFVWGKTNLFKYITREEFEEAIKTPTFKPLLTQHHKTYSDRLGPVCFYRENIYCERADNWLFNNPDLALSGQFLNWQEWCARFRLPMTQFIPFAPGGNYLLTREKVHKYSRDYYMEMRDTLPYAQNPVEAHCAERSYYFMFNGN